MAFVTGLLLIDAPASALNNLGNIVGERDENTVGVKMIRTREGAQRRSCGWKAGEPRRFTVRRRLHILTATQSYGGMMICLAICVLQQRSQQQRNNVRWMLRALERRRRLSR